MQFDGTGFTPAGAVNLLFMAGGEIGSFAATADAAGAFHASLRAPDFDTFDEDPPAFNMNVSINDAAKFGPDGPIGPPEETFAFVRLRITQWSADVAEFERASVRAGQRVTLETRGWTGAGDALYIHYVRNGKAVRSEKLGALKGPCGDMTKSFKAFAFKSAKPGNYAVRFSTQARWDKDDRWMGYKRVKLAE